MQILTMVLTFVFKYLLPEYFAAKKKAREEEEAFELSEERWAKIVDDSLIRLRGNLRKDSSDAGRVDDQMDKP